MNVPKCKLDKGRGKKAPLYKQVSDQLTAQIKSGNFGAGDRLPAVSKLVKAWDINYQTVNLALERMEDQGLIRCEPGRGKGPLVLVGSAQKFSIAFVRWSNDGYPMEICEGIRKFAEEKEVRFSITHYQPSTGDLAGVMASLSTGNTGLIMLPMHTPEFTEACRQVEARGDKIVLVDECLEDFPVSAISIDHAGGAHQITSHLLREHSRPVYCFGVSSRLSVQERVSGWEGAMSRYGFADHKVFLVECPAIDPMMESPGHQAFKDNYESAKKMLGELAGSTPLSIFACTGYAAQGLYKAAADIGLQIGKDLFVGGFGDDAFCRRLPVPLTNIRQDWELLGREAASILVAEMSGVIRHTMHHLLPAKLQIRASSTGLKDAVSFS